MKMQFDRVRGWDPDVPRLGILSSRPRRSRTAPAVRQKDGVVEASGAVLSYPLQGCTQPGQSQAFQPQNLSRSPLGLGTGWAPQQSRNLKTGRSHEGRPVKGCSSFFRRAGSPPSSGHVLALVGKLWSRPKRSSPQHWWIANERRPGPSSGSSVRHETFERSLSPGRRSRRAWPTSEGGELRVRHPRHPSPFPPTEKKERLANANICIFNIQHLEDLGRGSGVAKTAQTLCTEVGLEEDWDDCCPHRWLIGWALVAMFRAHRIISLPAPFGRSQQAAVFSSSFSTIGVEVELPMMVSVVFFFSR